MFGVVDGFWSTHDVRDILTLPGLRPCVNCPAAVRACLYGGSVQVAVIWLYTDLVLPVLNIVFRRRRGECGLRQPTLQDIPRDPGRPDSGRRVHRVPRGWETMDKPGRSGSDESVHGLAAGTAMWCWSWGCQRYDCRFHRVDSACSDPARHEPNSCTLLDG